jgi:hypothetical protein
VHDNCYTSTDNCDRCKCDAELIAEMDKVSLRGVGGRRHPGKACKQRPRQAFSRERAQALVQWQCSRCGCMNFMFMGAHRLPRRLSRRTAAVAAASTSSAGRTTG